MGLCAATPDRDTTNRDFDVRDYRELYEGGPYPSNPVHAHKVLVLGTGSVGKSTILKSLEHKNGREFGSQSEMHMDLVRGIIRLHLAETMNTLLKQSQIVYESNIDEKVLSRFVDVNHESVKEKVQLFVSLLGTSDLDIERKLFELDSDELHNLGEALHAIWKLPGIQRTFESSNKRGYWLSYFFEKASECFADSYSPSLEDWLKLGGDTGLSDHITYESMGAQFYLFALGGNRSKWIMFFEHVSCVLFVCALDQFCRSMFEDEQRIGLLENIQLFDELINGRYFKGAQFVLLLNKMDLFPEALKVTPLTFCFGDEYQGRNYQDGDFKWIAQLISCLSGNMSDENVMFPADVLCIIAAYFNFNEYWLDLCVQDGIQFITQKYLRLKKDSDGRRIFVHQVCAVDPDQVAKVMRDAQDIIVRSTQSSSRGLYF